MPTKEETPTNLTTEEIIDILTNDEENLKYLKEFLVDYTGEIPYQAYALAVSPRSALYELIVPGLDYEKLNKTLKEIQKTAQKEAKEKEANAEIQGD